MNNTFTPFLTIFNGLAAYHEVYNELGQMNTILLLQKRYNYRISEMLRLTGANLLPDFNISIKLSKCTAYTIIRDEELWILLSEIFSHNYNNGFTVIYKQYYNYLQKYHQNLIIKSKIGNNKVTHSFRYRKAKEFKKALQSDQIIKAQLHHQSKTSQKYYLKP